jgi:catechol 2,3-dioxygenase-like lactoylglutathione lyase family enzyme
VKIHLSLPTNDIAKSVSFYQTLLGQNPVKNFEDYALFIAEDPGLELALDLQSDPIAAESAHYGVAVETTQAVESAIARLQAAGLPAATEREESCCYALQTKVWTADPDGRRWEIYTVLEETLERATTASACC